MEQDLDNAGQEKADIQEITKTLNEVHFASTIKLNVGGKIYKTTLDTLRKDPDSMLCAMFSGRFKLKADEDDGAYFIDRDAELFRYVSLYITPISSKPLWAPNLVPKVFSYRPALKPGKRPWERGCLGTINMTLRNSVIIRGGILRRSDPLGRIYGWIPSGDLLG